MTVQQVNQKFNLNIGKNTDNITLYGSYHAYIKITKDLVIREVELTFNNDRLIVIKSAYSEHLHNGLSQIYGLENRYSSSNGVLFKYVTNSPKISCVGLLGDEMVIFNNQIDYPLFYKKMNPAMWELNKAEGFKGL